MAQPGTPRCRRAAARRPARAWEPSRCRRHVHARLTPRSPDVSLPAIACDLAEPDHGTWSHRFAWPTPSRCRGPALSRASPVRLFVASVIAVLIASWLCGLAPTAAAERGAGAHGFVAGPMIRCRIRCCFRSYPRAFCRMAMARGADDAGRARDGPLLGGWITTNRVSCIFYITIPVGIVAAPPRGRSTAARTPIAAAIDGVGLALLVCGSRAADDSGPGKEPTGQSR